MASSSLGSYDTLEAIDFVEFRYGIPGNPEKEEDVAFLLKGISNFYSSNKSRKNLKVLDYGCGPTIHLEIGAVPIASEIVLAEHNKNYRAFVQKWLDRDPTAYDWSPYIKYVVEKLEGGSEEEAVRREVDLCSKVKAVVPCDFDSKEAFIAKGYEGPYDIVICSLCFEVDCKDFETYKERVKKLAMLVKQGGSMLLFSTRLEQSDVGFYYINDTLFQNVGVQQEPILKCLNECGFNDIKVDILPFIPTEVVLNEGFMLFTASY